ncbi:FMN-dependent NADH-azoreductase [Fretibacter rubidus]|uniref:FMN-dependent NADH-azoreductase n=1 Tax=Fretibacter rubidus TaxID=570162 RepID=UPI00352BAFF3
MTKDLNRILRIDASARQDGSMSRTLADDVINHLSGLGAVRVTNRDVAKGLPFVDSAWVDANFTREPKRTEAHKKALELSDSLVDEIADADTLLIGMPIYNFGIPATLKAWVDMTARVGRTFNYTENGPVGKMTGKRAIVVVASGGTKVGSDIDFATPYLTHALGFIGIDDVTFIKADGLGRDAEKTIAAAKAAIAKLT